MKEAAEFDILLKKHGLNRAQFIRLSIEELRKNLDFMRDFKKNIPGLRTVARNVFGSFREGSL